MEDEFDRAEELALSSYTLHDMDFPAATSSRSRQKGGSFMGGRSKWEEEIDEAPRAKKSRQSQSPHPTVVPTGATRDSPISVLSSPDSCEERSSSDGGSITGSSSGDRSSVSAHPASSLPATGARPALTSSRWLTSFLSSSRTASTPPPPPPSSPLRTDYLQQFDQTSRAHRRSNDSPEHSEEASVEYISEDDEETGVFAAREASKETGGGDDERLLVYMFNLPYTITAEGITRTALKFGVRLSAVTLNKDATGRPAGSAVCACEALVSASSGQPFSPEERPQQQQQDLAEMCAFMLVEKMFGGRPLRVQTAGQMRAEKGRRRLDNIASGGGRYFGVGDMSVKCHQCGEVGHRAQECLEEQSAMNPCHLCASTQHDAAACHNIVCFQCSSFGHHSRDCSSKQRSYGDFTGRRVICTLCGGFTHDSRRCRQNSTAAKKQVEGAEETLECMCCGKLGHAMCLRVPAVDASVSDGALNLYCPKCGAAGHHADYVVNEYQEPSCRQPHFTGRQRAPDSHHAPGGSGRGSGSSSGHSYMVSGHSSQGKGGGKGGGHDRNWSRLRGNAGAGAGAGTSGSSGARAGRGGQGQQGGRYL